MATLHKFIGMYGYFTIAVYLIKSKLVMIIFLSHFLAIPSHGQYRLIL